jgi:hypothetical protein
MHATDPYFAVVPVLEALVAEPAIPPGVRGQLFAVHDDLVDTGDILRARLCGEASVTLLRLEAAQWRADAEALASYKQRLTDLLDRWRDTPAGAADEFDPAPAMAAA